MGFFDGLFGKKKSKSVIGIDVGSSSLKVVQLRREEGTAVLETYGEIALGPYAGAENQRLFGWIAPQTLKINPLFGTAQFTIQGPSWWLGCHSFRQALWAKETTLWRHERSYV